MLGDKSPCVEHSVIVIIIIINIILPKIPIFFMIIESTGFYLLQIKWQKDT